MLKILMIFNKKALTTMDMTEYKEGIHVVHFIGKNFNPSPAEYNMPCLSNQCRFRSVGFSWLLQKPTDLDLHCLSLNTSM